MNDIYENEQLFEEVNSRMAKATAALEPNNFSRASILELFCECANKACQEPIRIPYEAYAAIKNNAHSLSFVVKPEHYIPEFERVIKEMPGYWIIVKRPEKLDKPFEV